MNDRILELGDTVRGVAVHDELLVIQADGKQTTVPLSDVAVVVVSHASVRLTAAAIARSVSRGTSWVFCNEGHSPAGLCLPLDGHVTQVERFRVQASASAATVNRCWKQIIEAKVRSQAQLLEDVGQESRDLFALATRVKTGDCSNVEAQSARLYWPRLFGDPTFRRDRGRDDQNRFLNYGYAVLRALTARAICSAGLHPGIGIHHHNKYAGFCLADDLMEPYRALVDWKVVEVVTERGAAAVLDRSTKQQILSFATARYLFGRESRTLFDVLARLASSLVAVFEKRVPDLRDAPLCPKPVRNAAVSAL